MKQQSITVVGAGIAGLWQALTLARAGHDVRLVEASPEPFAGAASRFAGAMLAPFCEAEEAHPVIRDLGVTALPLWREAFPQVTQHGSLVLAGPRDGADLKRYARLTAGHEELDAEGLARLEPDLGGRFRKALFYGGEAHMDPVAAMTFLLEEIRRAGADVQLGRRWRDDGKGLVIDCRGLAARGALTGLRGVRGERLIIRTRELAFARPVRLLHPRHPLYVVPWGFGRFMLGASVIESDDDGPMTLRSALELLGMAYALHPAFGEAQILELGAGVRPAFPDNAPKIIARGRHIHVNGLYRNGFLLAPVLAELVARYLKDGRKDERVFEKE